MAFGRGEEVWSTVVAQSMGLVPYLNIVYLSGDVYSVSAKWHSDVSVFVVSCC